MPFTSGWSDCDTAVAAAGTTLMNWCVRNVVRLPLRLTWWSSEPVSNSERVEPITP
ncbi:hypothetical protein D3C87_1883070 [compost metagenome]